MKVSESEAMYRVSIILFALLVAVGAARDVIAESAFTFGSNPQLSAGARALQIGNYPEGINLTLAGLKTESSLLGRARALSNLCAGYTATHQYELALGYCNSAIEINDRNWRSYNNRALAFLGMGQIAAARRDLEQGLLLNPDSSSLGKVAKMIEAHSRALKTAQVS